MIVALLNSILWRNDHGKHFVMDFFFHQQVSYSSTSPELSDRNRYPYFYRTIPDDTSFSAPRVALLKTFKWSHVGVIFQEEDIHRTVTITPFPHNNVGIVGLLWMNRHQHCVGGGEGEVDRKSYAGKSAKCPN